MSLTIIISLLSIIINGLKYLHSSTLSYSKISLGKQVRFDVLVMDQTIKRPCIFLHINAINQHKQICYIDEIKVTFRIIGDREFTLYPLRAYKEMLYDMETRLDVEPIVIPPQKEVQKKFIFFPNRDIQLSDLSEEFRFELTLITYRGERMSKHGTYFGHIDKGIASWKSLDINSPFTISEIQLR